MHFTEWKTINNFRNLIHIIRIMCSFMAVIFALVYSFPAAVNCRKLSYKMFPHLHGLHKISVTLCAIVSCSSLWAFRLLSHTDILIPWTILVYSYTLNWTTTYRRLLCLSAHNYETVMPKILCQISLSYLINPLWMLVKILKSFSKAG